LAGFEDVGSFVGPEEAEDVNVLMCGEVALSPIVGWIYIAVLLSLAIPEESNLDTAKFFW
jgi:hypothetical protein